MEAPALPTTCPPALAAPLRLDGRRRVSLGDLYDVACRGRALELTEAAWARVEAARAQLDRLVEERRLLYGVTTGYGPLATQHVSPDEAGTLQRNLVYHLTSGVGPPLAPDQTRAVMAARAINLSRGHSAVRRSALELLLGALRHDVLPLIPCMGTVGASGDLTPLAHMTLALMGEAPVLFRGQRWPAAEALAACGLKPLALTHKEGLAFVNGTSAMTGIAALNGVRAGRALRQTLALVVLYGELMGGRLEAYHPRIAEVRPHPGQVSVTEQLYALARASDRIAPVPSERPRLDDALADQPVLPDRPILQDAYTLRCAPQICGAVADVLRFHDETVETELNSVTDNPLFFPEADQILHGGNFYGQHVAFASDALHNAVVKLAVYAERRIARITDPSLNGSLPAFLQGRDTGLHSGFMGAQVTATAVVAEMRAAATPASIQSISTNANNQDVVSMGTIAARKVADALDHLQRVLAIEAIILTQGYELEGGFDGGAGFAPSSDALATTVRRHAAFLDADRPLYDDIARLAGVLRTWEPMAA